MNGNQHGNGAAAHGNGNRNAGPVRRLEDGRQTTSTPGLTIGRLYLAELQFREGELVSAQVESADGCRLVAAAERFFAAVAQLRERPGFETAPITQVSVAVAPDLSMRLVNSGSVHGTPTIVFGFRGQGELPTGKASEVRLEDGTLVTLAHSFTIDGAMARSVWQTLKAASVRQDQRRGARGEGFFDDSYDRPLAMTA